MATLAWQVNSQLMLLGIAIYYGVFLLAMQLPTSMVSANYSHGDKHCGCAGTAPQNITVYNYLSIQGPNSTAGYNTAQCGQPVKTQPNSFGREFCFDMPLLLEQDLNSTLLGVVQGTYVFVSLAAPGTTLFVSETFTLNTSITAQGTFSAAGLEQIGQVSSKPITGGTDAFAFLTGVAITTPISNGVDSNGNLVSWFQYVFTFRSTLCS